MGWAGYGLYAGDDTQTRHLDFMKWAKINSDDEHILGLGRKTSVPKEARHLLYDNLNLILKRMPKLKSFKLGNEKILSFRDEDDAIEWQMLLALFLDSKLTPPKIVYDNGLKANDYLKLQHASEFDEPSRRRAALKNFEKKARKIGFVE